MMFKIKEFMQQVVGTIEFVGVNIRLYLIETVLGRKVLETLLVIAITLVLYFIFSGIICL